MPSVGNMIWENSFNIGIIYEVPDGNVYTLKYLLSLSGIFTSGCVFVKSCGVQLAFSNLSKERYLYTRSCKTCDLSYTSLA